MSIILAAALRDRATEGAILDGLKAMVVYYYDNYTDADHLDPAFLGAVDRLVDHLASAAPSIDVEYAHEALREAEQEYAELTPEPWRNRRTTFHTQALYVADDEDDE